MCLDWQVITGALGVAALLQLGLAVSGIRSRIPGSMCGGRLGRCSRAGAALCELLPYMVGQP